MNMPMVYYTQNCIIGFAILAIVALNFRKILDRRQFSHVMFLSMMLSVALALASEYAFYMLNGKGGAAAGIAVRAVLVLLFALEPVPEALWIGYLYGVTHREERPSRLYALLILLPVAINLAITLFSISGGYLFVVDELNRFHRGSAYILTPILCYSYLAYYLCCAFRERRTMLRRELRSVLLALMPMALAGVVQVAFVGIYVTWLAAAFSIMILYSGIMIDQANTDYLTGLASRRKFDGRLSALFDPGGCRTPTALILVDIDNFKSINDRFGHPVGDRALEAVGGALKRSARKRDLVARVGGDEFALLAEAADPSDSKCIADRVRENIKALNQKRLFPFSIEVSVGSGACNEWKDLTPEAFLKQIDDRMYNEKKTGDRRRSRDGFQDPELLKI